MTSNHRLGKGGRGRSKWSLAATSYFSTGFVKSPLWVNGGNFRLRRKESGIGRTTDAYPPNSSGLKS